MRSSLLYKHHYSLLEGPIKLLCGSLWSLESNVVKIESNEVIVGPIGQPSEVIRSPIVSPWSQMRSLVGSKKPLERTKKPREGSMKPIHGSMRSLECSM